MTSGGRSKVWEWIFIAAAVGFTVAIICASVLMYRSMSTSADILNDAYAADFACNLYIEHLSAKDAQWPSNWSDLDDVFSRVKQANGYELSEQALRQRITLDFSITRAQFTSDSSLNLITLTDGRKAFLSGNEPNQKLRAWLKSKSQP